MKIFICQDWILGYHWGPLPVGYTWSNSWLLKLSARFVFGTVEERICTWRCRNTKNPKGLESWVESWNCSMLLFFFATIFLGIHKSTCIQVYICIMYMMMMIIYIFIYLFIYLVLHIHTYIYILYSNLKNPYLQKQIWSATAGILPIYHPWGDSGRPEKGCSSRLFSMKWLDSVWGDYGWKVFRLVLLVCCFYGIMSSVGWKQAKTIYIYICIFNS